MTKTAVILVSQPVEGVCQITLNRPEKRNALNGPLIQAWLDALLKCETDKRVKLVMFAGNGEHFCAGADLAWMQKMAASSHAENVEDALQLATLLKKIYRFPKPTLSLMQGAVMGGALGVAAVSDIVIAAEDAQFCFSEVKMGLTPSVISPYVIKLIGARAARYYFLSAEKFNVSDAMKLNLVQRTAAKDVLIHAGVAFAQQILKNSPHALLEAKKLIRHVQTQKYTEGLVKFTAEHLATMRESEDAQEGLKAFLEKRAPVWE